MENLDLLVLRDLRDWRRAGQRALLVTVVRTWGSSPRPIGSILALSDSGRVTGSVSGGCIEDDLVYRYRQLWRAGDAPMAPTFLTYGVSADEAHRFGLPCGGTLELLVEHDPDAAELDALLQSLAQGGLVRRRVALADGHAVHEEARQHEDQPEDLRVDAEQMVNLFGPRYRMLLIGGGQLSEYLATMALFSGFEVAVCEPREEVRAAWRVAGATLVDGMPDDAVLAFVPDSRSVVIALSHDPKLDDLALLEALRTEAFYVGAIGSRRNNDARRQRLEEHFDLSAVELARLRGPVGVYIGSKTPPEIAVSILAEVVAAKNGVVVPHDMLVAPAKNLLAETPPADAAAHDIP
ncbi:MAG: XdhC family protein [Burkholderiaceae bacterium]